MRWNRWLTVSEAADRLDLSPRRVRALLAAGELFGEHHGRWEVDPASVERLARVSRPVGRPWDAPAAWALLAAIDETLHVPEAVASSRVRQRASDEGLARLAPRLRRRAKLVRARVHPSLRDRVADELVLSGVDAIPDDAPERLGDDSLLEGYAPASRVDGMFEEALLVPDPEGDVIVHSVDDELWPFAPDAERVPPVVAALDLLESGDERSMRAGRALLAHRVATS